MRGVRCYGVGTYALRDAGVLDHTQVRQGNAERAIGHPIALNDLDERVIRAGRRSIIGARVPAGNTGPPGSLTEVSSSMVSNSFGVSID